MPREMRESVQTNKKIYGTLIRVMDEISEYLMNLINRKIYIVRLNNDEKITFYNYYCLF